MSWVASSDSTSWLTVTSGASGTAERHDQLLGRGQQRRCPHWSHLRHRSQLHALPGGSCLHVHAESDDAECDRGGADDERHGDAFLLVVLVDGVDGGELDSPESELGNRDGHGGGDDRSQPDRGRALVERHDRGADAERQPELLHGDLQPDFGQFWRWRWNRLGGRHGAERMSLGREQRLHVLAHGHVRGEWYCERHDQLLGRGQQRRCPHWSHLRHRSQLHALPGGGGDSMVELVVYRVTDASGTSGTANPGVAKTQFLAGDAVRVTLAARNTGSATEEANWVLNLAPQGNHVDVRYNSDPTPNETNDKTLPNDGQWYYYSFDWLIPGGIPTGPYDLLAAIRRAHEWDTVLDDSQPGLGTRLFGSAAHRHTRCSRSTARRPRASAPGPTTSRRCWQSTPGTRASRSRSRRVLMLRSADCSGSPGCRAVGTSGTLPSGANGMRPRCCR